MMTSKNSENRKKIIPIIITLTIIILGSVYYVFSVVPTQDAMKNQAKIYEGAQFKVAFSNEGSMKIFVLATEDGLKYLSAKEGSNTPFADGLVIGAAEASMMHEEKLFSKIGDKISGLFGIDTKIAGVLKVRGDFTDDVHFVSKEQFAQLQADNNKITTKTAPDGSLKVFYNYNSEELPKLQLAEGSVSNYKKTVINNKEYTPVLIGAKEAAMMRKEKLFSKVGDTIDNLFGKDIVIVGVLSRQNNAIDMMHFIQE